MKWILSLCMMILCSVTFSLDRLQIMNFSSYFDSNVFVVNDEIKKLGNSEEEKIKKGILYLSLAIQEPPVEKASLKAVEILKEFEKKNVDRLLKAYLAMSYSLGSRDDKNPLKKMKYADNCIKLFNAIVAEDENDWYVRFLRAQCFAAFPDFFKVGDIAESDFKFLQNLYENKKENIHPTIAVRVYYYLGEFAKSKKDLDKAIAFWKKAVSIADENHITNDSYRKAKARIKVFEE